MALPTITVTPSAAAQAYRRTDAGDPSPASASGGSFGAMLEQAAKGVVQAGHQADALSMQAVSGNADVTSVVAAVSRAELALQTTVAIRDRVVQAYQEIMRMPI